jgi:hypothetical protein
MLVMIRMPRNGRQSRFMASDVLVMLGISEYCCFPRFPDVEAMARSTLPDIDFPTAFAERELGFLEKQVAECKRPARNVQEAMTLGSKPLCETRNKRNTNKRETSEQGSRFSDGPCIEGSHTLLKERKRVAIQLSDSPKLVTKTSPKIKVSNVFNPVERAPDPSSLVFDRVAGSRVDETGRGSWFSK